MSDYAPIIQLSALSGVDGFVINGIDVDDKSGSSVSAAGDVNDDGFADVIIGADEAAADVGESYVVFGAASFGASVDLAGLTGANGFRLDGIDAGDHSGVCVASAGDINDDGIDDVIIGAGEADTLAGESYIVFGKTAGWTADLDLGSLNGATGVRLDGIDSLDRAGLSVSGAGDVNADGIDDVVIGAYGADPGGDLTAGETYVVFGTNTAWGASLNLSTLNGATGFRIDGIDPDDQSGLHVASAGDVNGDTYDDLILAAPGIDDGGVDAGGAYVVFGAGSWGASFDLAGLTGANGFRIDATVAGDFAGEEIASAGDLNGDGLADLVVTNEAADPGGRTSAGEAYVLFGQASGWGASFDLANLDGTNGFVVEGIANGDILGTGAAAAGDFNADGFGDLLLGAEGGQTVAGNNAGECYIIFGKANGWSANFDLTTLDGDTGIRIDGVISAEQAGSQVSGAGDVNGDGIDDVVIGAPHSDAGGDNRSGASYVLFGALPGEAVVRVGSAIAQVIRGGAFADELAGRGGDDSLYGNGGDDVLIGGAGNDLLDGGSAKDTASYAGAIAAVTVSLITALAQNTGGAGTDTLDSVENLDGSRFGDTLFSDAGKNKIRGLGGHDTLWASFGEDILSGGAGIDTVTFDAVAAGVSVDLTIGDYQATVGLDEIKLNGVENLIGSDFRDTLAGAAGDNVLQGGLDNDTITGGLGGDTLTGSFGREEYLYNAVADSLVGNEDLITDLSDAFDDIDLSAIDADEGTGGDQAFVVVAAFSSTAGELRVTYDLGSNTTTAAGDTDGDGAADMAILLTGDHTAYAGWVL